MGELLDQWEDTVFQECSSKHKHVFLEVTSKAGDRPDHRGSRQDPWICIEDEAKKYQAPKVFRDHYPDVKVELVSLENFMDFVLG